MKNKTLHFEGLITMGGNCLNFVIILMMIESIVHGYSTGMSYSKFSGPVSGPVEKITVTDSNGNLPKSTYDYVAKPDYHFAYGVKDPKSRVLQSRQETRVGDNVKGEYSVLDPDGKFRTVKYTADKHNGFHARIIADGHEYAFYPPPLPVPPNPAPVPVPPNPAPVPVPQAPQGHHPTTNDDEEYDGGDDEGNEYDGSEGEGSEEEGSDENNAGNDDDAEDEENDDEGGDENDEEESDDGENGNSDDEYEEETGDYYQ